MRLLSSSGAEMGHGKFAASRKGTNPHSMQLPYFMETCSTVLSSVAPQAEALLREHQWEGSPHPHPIHEVRTLIYSPRLLFFFFF